MSASSTDTAKEQKAVNKIAAEMLAVLDTFPDALPNDYSDEEGWPYTNMLYHSLEAAKHAVRQYVKYRGDPKTFRPAKKLPEIKGSVRLYLIPNPAYLNGD